MFDSNVRNFVLHHRPSPPFLPRAQEFVGNRSYYLDKNAIPPALLARLVEHLKQEGKVLWSQPLDHGSLLHVRDVDDDARDADDTDRSPLPWAAAPPIRTSGGGDLPVSAGVRDDSGIGDGGCLAYALGKLDTGITAGMLNTAAELLIEQKGGKGPKLKMVYRKFDFWPAKAVPLAFKSLGRPFVWKKLKGDELSDTKLKRLLNSKGRFVVDGYMAKEFLWKDEKKRSRDERKILHDDPPSESRHAIAVKNGRVYCRNLAGKQKPKVNSVLHIGPKMKTDGYLCLIAKVYKLQE